MPQTDLHPRKLDTGDKIKTTGWPHPDLEDGREYRVAYIDYMRGHPYYGFRLNRGSRIVARYFCVHIDRLIGAVDQQLTIEQV